jgi:uracil-DNA glycosylase
VRILLIGQTPGRKVHATGIPWADPSGDELRRWLQVSRDEFYNTRIFGQMPMGFCYPGKGRSGDLAPRPECAPAWHKRILEQLPELQLILLIGSYSQKYYLGKSSRETLTENVRHFRDFLPRYFPLVHPSPRNNAWFKNNPWFEREVLPELRDKVQNIRLVKKQV